MLPAGAGISFQMLRVVSFLPLSACRRASINSLKEMFRDEMSKDDWRLVIALKKTFGID